MIEVDEREQEPADPRLLFGEALRDARELAPGGPISQTRLGQMARTSKSAISRIERGVPPIPPALPAVLDQILLTGDGRFQRLYDQLSAGRFPAQHRLRMELERKASDVWEWAPTAVPGLLQTAAYAREVLRSGSPRAGAQWVESKVEARLSRQDRLASDFPPDVRVVLCESVLYRTIGGPEVMREQLGALLAYGAHPTIRVNILSMDAGPHLLMDAPVTFLNSDGKVHVCVEAFRTGAVMDDPEAVKAATLAYDGITADALGSSASAALIRRTMEAL